jgi:hypothetical protein
MALPKPSSIERPSTVMVELSTQLPPAPRRYTCTAPVCDAGMGKPSTRPGRPTRTSSPAIATALPNPIACEMGATPGGKDWATRPALPRTPIESVRARDRTKLIWGNPERVRSMGSRNLGRRRRYVSTSYGRPAAEFPADLEFVSHGTEATSPEWKTAPLEFRWRIR